MRFRTCLALVSAAVLGLALGGCQSGGGLTPAEAQDLRTQMSQTQTTLDQTRTQEADLLARAQAAQGQAQLALTQAQQAQGTANQAVQQASQTGNTVAQAAAQAAAAKAAADSAVASTQLARATTDAKGAQQAIDLAAKVQGYINAGTPIINAALNPDGTFNLSAGGQAAATTIGTAVGGPIGMGLMLGIPLLISTFMAVRKHIQAGQATEAAATSQDAASSLADMVHHLASTNPEDNAAAISAQAATLLTPAAIDLYNGAVAAKAVSTQGV